MITPSTVLVGFLGSVVAEILKLIPALNKNAITSSIVAIVVVAVGTYLANGSFTFDNFASSLVFALTSYKAIVQPVSQAVSSPTQV
jgi:putative flippase GtrA